jgi:cytochrome c peroxidase
MRIRSSVPRVALIVGLMSAAWANAQDPASIAGQYAAAAKLESPAFAGFAAERGKQLFNSTRGSEWSCASCHTQNPLRSGRHARTSKEIAPLAPAANPRRFTSLEKADKWFKRNCNDVLGRPCTSEEKGDVLAYLMSLK